MTIEEAIKIVRGESVGYPVSCDEQINAAECVADYAEKYLKQKEAWEKVKEEISEAYKDFQNDDTCIANGINICRRIIDKHLSEVSE